MYIHTSIHTHIYIYYIYIYTYIYRGFQESFEKCGNVESRS